MMAIGKGKPIKRLRKGQGLGTNASNVLIDFYNAFINGQIKDGELLISDKNIVWKIKTGTTGSGNSSYRGEYAPDGTTEFGSGPFAFGDIVRVSDINPDSVPGGGSIIPGVYVCTQAGPTEDDLPNHPLSDGGETAFWQWLSTWPSTTSTCDESGETIVSATDTQPKTL